MASPQLLFILLQLLLASKIMHASPARSLSSRPLHDGNSAAATSSSASTDAVVGLSGDASSTADSSLTLSRLSSSSPPPAASPPWELELAPYLADIPTPRDPNATVLRGPPRLGGVFKGSWIRTAYGASLRPQNTLVSERGVVVLRLPEDPDPVVTDAPGDLYGGGAAHLPGGVQELRGELVIRDGEHVTDHDLKFRFKGVYVPAAGAVHVVLEPQLPLVLKAELEPGAGGAADPNRGLRGADPDPGADLDSELGLDPLLQRGHHGLAGAAAVAAAARRAAGTLGGGHVSGDGAGGGGGGAAGWAAAGGGGGDGSGYREALRTAARNLVVLGPAWHRTLVRHPPPPPPSPLRGRGGGAFSHFRRAAAEAAANGGGGGSSSAPAPPAPPRPPLELALLQKCELRAEFRVYYKGDPSAKSHVHYLRLDQPAAPPSPPPAAGAAGGAVGAAAARQSGGADAGAAAVRQRRHLAADTEIFHSTQVQLRSTNAAGAAAAAAAATATSAEGTAEDGDGMAAAAVPDVVYGIPPGMDPLDPDLELVGLVLSPNCDFVVHFNATSVHLERYYRQAVRYSVLVAAVTIGQIVLSVIQSEAASSPSAAARTSLYAVTLQAILDAYQCLLHLTGAMVVDALFLAFASISFLQFLLFAVFEMRQALLVWRAQRTNGNGAGADFWSARRDMSAVYFRFYALMLLGLVLMFQWRSQLALLVLALHSWWLPQLIHSATTDTRPPLKAGYVWGMSALRLVSPLYFYGCPSNLLRVEQHPRLCLALAAWVGLQAALVTAQMNIGPRIFIPRAFLPRRYDYNRPATKREMGVEEADSAGAGGGGGGGAAAAATCRGAGPSAAPAGRALPTPLRRLASWLRRQTSSASTSTSSSWSTGRWFSSAIGVAARSAASGADGGGDLETGHGSKECVICMNPVPLLPLRDRMLTPCGHFFHEACLTRWMEVKMDCPTCRRPLPPA